MASTGPMTDQEWVVRFQTALRTTHGLAGITDAQALADHRLNPMYTPEVAAAERAEKSWGDIEDQDEQEAVSGGEVVVAHIKPPEAAAPRQGKVMGANDALPTPPAPRPVATTQVVAAPASPPVAAPVAAAPLPVLPMKTLMTYAVGEKSFTTQGEALAYAYTVEMETLLETVLDPDLLKKHAERIAAITNDYVHRRKG